LPQSDYIHFGESDEEQHVDKRARLDAPAPNDAASDAETAWALGFTPTTITAEEEDLLPVDGDEGVYTRVRCRYVSAGTLQQHCCRTLPAQAVTPAGLQDVAGATFMAQPASL